MFGSNKLKLEIGTGLMLLTKEVTFRFHPWRCSFKLFGTSYSRLAFQSGYLTVPFFSKFQTSDIYNVGMNLSFCGCGFLGIYHIGVIKALLNHAPKFLSKIERMGGASAGALAGAILTCNPSKLEVSFLHQNTLLILHVVSSCIIIKNRSAIIIHAN